MKKTVLLFLLCTIWVLESTSQVKKIKHVILIGIDGFGAYALPDADMPVLKQLMLTGSWSLKARSVLPSSSAVNWASMLMGTALLYTDIPSGIVKRRRYRLPQRMCMAFFLAFLDC